MSHSLLFHSYLQAIDKTNIMSIHCFIDNKNKKCCD